jgi:aerobic-type carbon monoxide dehydrogenase small subunit (CoxS/CutS family)
MADQIVTSLNLNGQQAELCAEARESLADTLRRSQGLRSIRLGCEHGACGACTIRVDGRSCRSCLMLAPQVEGSAVVTVEGMLADARFSAFVDGLARRNAFQCGFCATGMLTVLWELLEQTPDPDEQQVRECIAGNICRCTGYQSIVAGVLGSLGDLAAVAAGSEEEGDR